MLCSNSSGASGWVALRSVGLALGLVATATLGFATADEAKQAPKVRKFKFYYGATINELPPGARARVWIPVASSNHEQNVKLIVARTPGEPRHSTETTFGNHIIYFEAIADAKGEIALDAEYLVERRELLAGHGEAAPGKIPDEHLVSSKMIPVDGSLLKKLVGERAPDGDTSAKALALYYAVDDLMKYDKPDGQPWGRGDAVWACDSKYGNCTDFHSVFIGACRDLKIPAKFEMGFPIPETQGKGEVGGYHCWAKFINDGRWEAVDISEADKHPDMKQYYFGNLTADRVTFTTGRDLVLDPAPKAGPVNFLVYPYVEIDGKPHTKFAKRFRYEDVQ
ncbi:MAG: transglutaminase domain-containing protein [Pirellulales bacterium]